jgi:uroporphyrinogen decarboxylase
MTETQWNKLKAIIKGDQLSPVPVGFIIDSPWLPNWYGITILDYFSSEELWLKANLAALEVFPDIIFLPGFWSEFGMCTEPSAFGAKCIFWKDKFPFCEKTIHNPGEINQITPPDPKTDGLLPLVLNRLIMARKEIEAAGHDIRFSVSRGPLNIASFLMGTTEFLTTMMMQPDLVHKLLRMITDFLLEWHRLQRESFDTIDGILILDDIVGFIGEEEAKEFAVPYLTELYDIPASVKLFHNDADCTSSVKYYPGIGINLLNPGTHLTINQLKAATEGKIALLGNIPPRDVLASGSPGDVTSEVKKLLRETSDHSRLILSCGGGMPPGVSTENINAFMKGSKL